MVFQVIGLVPSTPQDVASDETVVESTKGASYVSFPSNSFFTPPVMVPQTTHINIFSNKQQRPGHGKPSLKRRFSATNYGYLPPSSQLSPHHYYSHPEPDEIYAMDFETRQNEMMSSNFHHRAPPTSFSEVRRYSIGSNGSSNFSSRLDTWPIDYYSPRI